MPRPLPPLASELSLAFDGAIDLQAAEKFALGHQDFMLWHNPARVIGRLQGYFSNGAFELVLSSAQVRLGYFSSIRHRVAHEQRHARQQFDATTMQLAGKRYAASRPGRFLRDWDKTVTPHRRWLSSIGNELANLARQLAP